MSIARLNEIAANLETLQAESDAEYADIAARLNARMQSISAQQQPPVPPIAEQSAQNTQEPSPCEST